MNPESVFIWLSIPLSTFLMPHVHVCETLFHSQSDYPLSHAIKQTESLLKILAKLALLVN